MPPTNQITHTHTQQQYAKKLNSGAMLLAHKSRQQKFQRN